jgi:lysophospholipase L1-like esterase
MESLRDAGLVADGTTTPDGTTKTGSQASDYVIGPAKRVGVASIARSAALAQISNPRINPVMTTPPTVTAAGTPTAGLTNVWSWDGVKAGVFNYYGGTPAPDGSGYVQFLSTTVSGALTTYVHRVEIVADAVKVQYNILNLGSGGRARFIVNGQYVSLTETAPPVGPNYITLDFTAAGGRAARSIIIESNMHFYGAYVGMTETVAKPTGVPLRMFVVGDSFTATGGMSTPLRGFAQIVADLLGVRDVWNNGIGSTGYLANAAGSQTTFRQRLSDMVAAAPDIVLIVGGHNDTGYTPAALQSELTAYLTAMRAQSVLSSIPIVIGGLNGANIATATTVPFENAMAAAVAAFADPLVFFIPEITGAAGPYFTGTGSTAAPAGNGNCDVYISSDAIHPNDAGHAFLAGRLADDIRRIFGQW